MQKHDLSKGQTRGVLGLKLLVAELQLAKQAWLDIEQHNEKFLKKFFCQQKKLHRADLPADDVWLEVGNETNGVCLVVLRMP